MQDMMSGLGFEAMIVGALPTQGLCVCVPYSAQKSQLGNTQQSTACGGSSMGNQPWASNGGACLRDGAQDRLETPVPSTTAPDKSLRRNVAATLHGIGT